jgi:hypothetical protein
LSPRSRAALANSKPNPRPAPVMNQTLDMTLLQADTGPPGDSTTIRLN